MAITMRMRKLLALGLGMGLIAGCASVKVVRNPDEGDTGVRFYRPKPYLLVTPIDTAGRLVNLKLEYLPDFSEEYSAHVKGKASVALKDGWNLIAVNTKEAPKGEDKAPPEPKDMPIPPAVVAASNVPIGYYESVYGYDGPRKFLQGWRYVGLTTLGGGSSQVCRVASHGANCPNGANGAGGAGGTNVGNGCINGPLYGLVFFNGAMTFRQLEEIANNQLCPTYVNPVPKEEVVTQPVKSQVMPDTNPRMKVEPNPPLTPIPGTPPIPPPSVPEARNWKPTAPVASTTKPTYASPSKPTVAASTPASPKPATSKPSATASTSAKPTVAASTSTSTSPGVYDPVTRRMIVPTPVASSAPNPAASPKPAMPPQGLPDLDDLPTLDPNFSRTGSTSKP